MEKFFTWIEKEPIPAFYLLGLIILGGIVLSLLLSGCSPGVNTGNSTGSVSREVAQTERVDPAKVPASSTRPDSPADRYARPQIGMSYSQFTALCAPDARKGDRFNRLELEGEVRHLVELNSTPTRDRIGCVGTFRFDGGRLALILD
jgi:hypothetical protein